MFWGPWSQWVRNLTMSSKVIAKVALDTSSWSRMTIKWYMPKTARQLTLLILPTWWSQKWCSKWVSYCDGEWPFRATRGNTLNVNMLTWPSTQLTGGLSGKCLLSSFWMMITIDMNLYSCWCSGQFQIAEVVLDKNGDRSNKAGHMWDGGKEGKSEQSEHIIVNIVARDAVEEIRSPALYVFFFYDGVVNDNMWLSQSRIYNEAIQTWERRTTSRQHTSLLACPSDLSGKCQHVHGAWADWHSITETYQWT
jgi:hypothetical protein